MTKPELNLNLKNLYAIVIAILLITDLTILVDIPVLRQIFAFLCFTILPGLLILYALNIGEIGFLKKFVLSIGLSISFLMFFGLFINTLYPFIGISRPLSTLSLLISLNAALFFLCWIGYKRNKENLNFSILNFNIKDYIKSITSDSHSLVSPLLFPLLFPFLSVFGTYLMNTEGNNIILMIMLFLIPIYVAFVVYFNKRIPKIVYPTAILMISISLLLMHGLRSSYVMGSDVHCEYYAFQVVARNAFWSMSNYHNVLTACLSTSLLPATYQGLLNMNGQYIYKLVYQLIFSITPLAVYVLSKRYVSELYAFIAAVFFMSQACFFYAIQSAMRTELAILFFALAMMVFFDDEIDKFNKKLIFLIFMFSVIVSHYTTAYISFFLILFVWLMVEPMKNFFKLKNPITVGVVALFSASIFLWYAQVTETSLVPSTSIFFRDTISNMAGWLFDEIKIVETFTTFGVKTEEIPEWITITKSIICNTANAFICIGVIGSIVKYIKYREGEIVYLSMTVVSWALMIMFVAMPYVYHYSTGRVYLQVLVFLALPFVTGGEIVSKSVYKVHCKIKEIKTNFRNSRRIQHASVPKYTLLIIMLILIPYFTCNTYLFYQILGVPYSVDINAYGIEHSKKYISDRDVIAARWANDHEISFYEIRADYAEGPLILGFGIRVRDRYSRISNETNKYIYLRSGNIVNKIMYTKEGIVNITETKLFIGMSKIYTNAGSEIWKGKNNEKN